MVFDAETVDLPDGKEETKVFLKDVEESRVYVKCGLSYSN